MVTRETELEESDTETVDPTNINKITTTQESNDANHAIYMNVDETQLCTSTTRGDDIRLHNVYIESDTEATDPTYGNIKSSITQELGTTIHTSCANDM